MVSLLWGDQRHRKFARTPTWYHHRVKSEIDGNRKENVIIHNHPKAGSPISRRAVLKHMLAGTLTGMAWPLVATSHPIHKHLANAATLTKADETLRAANWTPQFLSVQQNETLATLSEAIVPGSAKAAANRFMDLLLSVDTPENQKNFLTSLSAMDAESLHRFAKPFKGLAPAQQEILLTAASTQKIENSPENDDSASAQRPQNLREHFDNLKGWISGAYYSSEAGMRELGWTRDFAFESFPACPHPENHS